MANDIAIFELFNVNLENLMSLHVADKKVSVDISEFEMAKTTWPILRKLTLSLKDSADRIFRTKKLLSIAVMA